MTKLDQLADLGQAVWLDYIRRAFLGSGELQRLVESGVRGVTSNPTIFEKAIAGSTDYDDDLRGLAGQGCSADQIYEALVVDDIRRAADILRPRYEATDGGDGFVSLEVSPALADDSGGTVDEARRLFAKVDRPNVMIKVPATAAGVPAVETLIADGINVNVTLIFAVPQYEAVAQAYLAGLERRVAAGGGLGRVASVASFFVSRVDTATDAELARVGNTALQGRIANDNARLAYARFRELFSGPRWAALAEAGARVQRPLWASTGTKNPAYSDTLYVDELIGPDTVNTLPPATLEAFLDHGAVAVTVTDDVEGARARVEQLKELRIDLGAITDRLLDEGVAAFAGSFDSLMESIRTKRDAVLRG